MPRSLSPDSLSIDGLLLVSRKARKREYARSDEDGELGEREGVLNPPIMRDRNRGHDTGGGLGCSPLRPRALPRQGWKCNECIF